MIGVDEGAGGSHDVLAYCSQCNWRDWGISRVHAEGLLFKHVREVHGVTSDVYRRMQSRIHQRASRASRAP